MTFWHGLFLIVLSEGCKYYWTYIGAFVNLCTFNFYSVPAMEKHLLKSRPIYAEYKKVVSRVIPWFRSGELILKKTK